MTPEDREMHILAAKAAGLRVWESCGQMFVDPPPNDGKVSGVSWSPRTDDGDALRLAAQLGISIHVHPLHIGATTYGAATYLGDWRKRTLDDAADYRLAIFRAAAAIGRSMP